jgi:hypothetical protein
MKSFQQAITLVMLDMFRIFDARAIQRKSHPTTRIMRQTNFAETNNTRELDAHA